jgi:hypothetical protein
MKTLDTMKNDKPNSNFLPLGKLEESSQWGVLHFPSSIDADNNPRKNTATRKQKKHDLLVNFMEHAKHPKRKPAPARPRLLKMLLSLFF